MNEPRTQNGDVLSEAIPRLLGAVSWIERRQLLNDNADTFLSEAADGRLAVIRHVYAHDRLFQEGVDHIRASFSLARHDRSVGGTRPLSDYLRGVLDDGAKYSTSLIPAPPPREAEDAGLLGQVMAAFIFSRAWRERRHIVAGYPKLFSSGDPHGMIQQLKARADPSWGSLYDCMLAAVSEARRNPPAGLFLGARPDCFVSRMPGRERPLLTLEEATQFKLWEFIECPTWERRRELIDRYADLLLSDVAFQILGFLSDRYAGEPEVEQRLRVATRVLAVARSKGVEMAFVTPMPPTYVGPPRIGEYDVESPDGRAAFLGACRQVLHYGDPVVTPWAWSASAVRLAEALLEFAATEFQSVYVEEALDRCYQALEIIDETTGPAEWRHAQFVLARAYVARRRGDPSARLEASIKFFEKVMAADAEGQAIEDLAITATHLAYAYRERLEGAPAENLECAYRLNRKAVELLEGSGSTAVRAWAQAALGTVCLERIYGDPAQNTEEGTAYLSAVDPSVGEKVWLGVQRALGGAYAQRKGGSPEENLRLAVHHLTEALRVAERLSLDWERGTIMHGLGTAHFRILPSDRKARSRAVQYYKEALKVFDGAMFPAERRRTLRELGAAYFRDRRWQETSSVLQEAVGISDYLESSAYTQSGRLAEVAEIPDVYARLAYSRFRLGPPEEALVEFERGQARLLRDSLPPLVEGSTVPPGARQELDDAMRDLRELVWSPQDASGQEIGRARSRVASAREAIGEVIGEAPDVLYFDALQAIVPEGGALIAPLLTSQGSVIFILTGEGATIGDQDILQLDDFTDEDVRQLLDPGPERPGWLQAYAHWLDAYAAVSDAEESGADAGATFDAATEVWAETIDYVCRRLWDLFIGPIYERLKDRGVSVGSRLTLITSKWLSLLPLQAAWHETEGTRQYLIDEYSVSYAPSGFALAASLQRASERTRIAPSLLAVMDPTRSFRFADLERDAIIANFSGTAKALDADEATADRVIDELKSRTNVHFSCHGSFNWTDPLSSGLELAGGPLTIQDIAAKVSLSAAPLMTLSACETGLTETQRVPSEFIGLPTTLLQAGASSVVASLWSVDEESTATLMENFYRSHVKERMSAPEALRQGQLAVKDDERYAHPYYWAAFTATGA